MSSASLDERLRAFAATVDSPAEVLRRKIFRFVQAFNHGSTTISFHGLPINVVGLLESEVIRKHSDSELRAMLAILRE